MRIRKGFSYEVKRLLFFLGVALVVGFFTQRVLLVLLLVTGIYLAWMMWQLRRLYHWLEQKNHSPPPYSSAVWGDVSELIYQLQQNNHKQQQRLKAVLKRVQQTTAALADGVILLDPAGRSEWWNPAAAKLLGLRESDDLGQPLIHVVRDPGFVHYYQAKDYRLPLDLPSPRFKHRTLQLQLAEFGQGEYLLTVRDVSQVRSLEQLRKDFVANVSHELRTPLTVLIGYIETLIDNTDELPSLWGRAINQMSLQATRMENLINDLLLLANLESDKKVADDQEIKIKPLLATICADAQTLSGTKKHQIELSCPDEAAMIGVETELRSAFSNIVLNAVKYTPAEGRIDVQWWQDSTGAHLEVKDNGIGIDSRHIPRLTERFYRADSSRNSKTGGTGLGLAIVKHVLMRHDGLLDIESKLNEGSIFTCHFPLDRIPGVYVLEKAAGNVVGSDFVD